MTRQVEAVGSSSAFGRLLGLEIIKAEAGEARLRLRMHEGLSNVRGMLHGGALFSLIDTAMGQASHSLFGGEAAAVTLESKINYIRGVSEGEVLCRAWVVHAGKRTQVIEAEVHQGDKLIAKAQSTFAVL
ncbi:MULTISPECIES: PaaI family thioesterase [Pseudomonas]|uniref:Acyl-CoA thioesterase n=1 Tax=Pseudomonas kuykendallii TaxID=1007099 RepID=A0A1H2RH52_9PSED|nr:MULTISPECIES: PaaI family thioesterase [Pseudomonas]MCQ4272753.1 PaaI family thioesterase [Pseudomonas kuykendallii]SDW17979.1 acyl-CoA thioesterase [Pseudomonas kuykendallii]